MAAKPIHRVHEMTDGHTVVMDPTFAWIVQPPGEPHTTVDQINGPVFVLSTREIIELLDSAWHRGAEAEKAALRDRLEL